MAHGVVEKKEVRTLTLSARGMIPPPQDLLFAVVAPNSRPNAVASVLYAGLRVCASLRGSFHEYGVGGGSPHVGTSCNVVC